MKRSNSRMSSVPQVRSTLPSAERRGAQASAARSPAQLVLVIGRGLGAPRAPLDFDIPLLLQMGEASNKAAHAEPPTAGAGAWNTTQRSMRRDPT